MSSIQDEDKVQALFPDSPYPAFGICIGIGCQVGCVNDVQAFSLEECVKGIAEHAVIVVDQAAKGGFTVLESPNTHDSFAVHI
jgi:hypothetical protein